VPKSGFVSVTIREQVYELAKRSAQEEGFNLSQFTERALRSYMETLRETDDRTRRMVRIVNEVDRRNAKMRA